ncbi:MAG: hypothetical protein K8L97_19165 [Anaerolineae bacterium]|nr:hypothetical protein [Anaerolineae bacterium]
MSEQELYGIARQRIDRRNRRWTLWGVDLAGLILSVAALILLSETPYVIVSVAVMIGWAGVFVLHTIMAAMAQSRDEDIEKEVAKLREAAEMDYEKPKRLTLTEDGEITDYADEYEETERSLHS